jgi:hypothetical protein
MHEEESNNLDRISNALLTTVAHSSLIAPYGTTYSIAHRLLLFLSYLDLDFRQLFMLQEVLLVDRVDITVCMICMIYRYRYNVCSYLSMSSESYL